jgi:ribulose-5-phosphate 4-epimerase/fuculose-1-phosphate aldolase
MNEIATDPRVKFDPAVAEELVRYGRLLAARGYIHNAVGNIAIRVPHPDYPDGVVYTKPMGLSLEEVQVQHVVITDVPGGKLLYGSNPTAPGHQLNREFLKLRPDINSVIHVHDDTVIAYLALGFDDFIHCSMEFPYVVNLPPYIVHHHVDIEENVDSVKEFIQGTNAILMKRHGLSTLGRSVSEAYHRLNSVTAEIRRVMTIESTAASMGRKPKYLSTEEVQHMYSRAKNLRPYFAFGQLKRT